jgi:hypothetical protein
LLKNDGRRLEWKKENIDMIPNELDEYDEQLECRHLTCNLEF